MGELRRKRKEKKKKRKRKERKGKKRRCASEKEKEKKEKEKEKEKKKRKKKRKKKKKNMWGRILPLISHLLSLISFGFFCYAFATPQWFQGTSPRFSGEVTIGLWYVCQV